MCYKFKIRLKIVGTYNITHFIYISAIPQWSNPDPSPIWQKKPMPSGEIKRSVSVDCRSIFQS